MDNFHAQRLGDFETALSEATTVISRQPGRVIVDAGTSLWE
jgi:D-serine deaminase-like pyridoxal phosphate-dependent protein